MDEQGEIIGGRFLLNDDMFVRWTKKGKHREQERRDF